MPSIRQLSGQSAGSSRRDGRRCMGDSSYRDKLGAHAQLPAGYLIDKTGKMLERYVGRIPPEAWDLIADLL